MCLRAMQHAAAACYAQAVPNTARVIVMLAMSCSFAAHWEHALHLIQLLKNMIMLMVLKTSSPH